MLQRSRAHGLRSRWIQRIRSHRRRQVLNISGENKASAYWIALRRVRNVNHLLSFFRTGSKLFIRLFRCAIVIQLCEVHTLPMGVQFIEGHKKAGIYFTPGYETLGRITVSYSKPTTQHRRHMEHVYSEIGPPVLPPREYGDDYILETETPADEHADSANASSEFKLWENRKTSYTGLIHHMLSNRFNNKFKFCLISLLLSSI